MNKATKRRRQIVVDPELQKRMVMATAGPAGLGMAAAILLLGVFCSRLGSEALEAGVELPSLPWTFVATALLLVVALGSVIWSALRTSHRVAGPTRNIDRTLQQVRGGDLAARVRLRENDYVVEIAIAVNAHLDWLQTRLSDGAGTATTADPAAANAVPEPEPPFAAPPEITVTSTPAPTQRQ